MDSAVAIRTNTSVPPKKWTRSTCSFGSGQYADPGGTDRAAQPIHGGRQREIVRGILATAIRIPDHPHGA